jgi:hypothetical protein
MRPGLDPPEPELHPLELAGPSHDCVAALFLTAVTFGLLAYATDRKGHHIIAAMVARCRAVCRDWRPDLRTDLG